MRAHTEFKKKIKVLFTDIDDTLTIDGQLPAQSYEMLWKLQESGVAIVPVTGRPAGWCEMIARMWPVHGIIGENGAFSFQYQNKKMHRHFALDEGTRLKNNQKLKKIEQEILNEVPGSALASDQFTRLFDLAIDFCEDVAPLGQEAVDQILEIFKKHGAIAKVSSIHVNGWFGDYNKLSMCKDYFLQNFSKNLEQAQSDIAFIGDSPNDEPMFEFFENSFAVANIKQFIEQLKHPPNYVTSKPAGLGFVEFAQHLLG